MSYLFFTLGLVSLASAAVLQLPQTIAQAIPAPSSDPLGQWINSNVSLSSAPSATISESEWIATLSGTPNLSAGMKYKCDGGKWDRNLNTQSCLSAWASIRKGAGPALTFGPRGGERPHDVGLPQRYLSSDGTCAIEPLLLPGRWSGRAKLADLAEASYVVIDGCVDGKPLSGGVAWGFGGDGNLGLTVSRFRPEVRCHGRLPSDARILDSCNSLADRMQTSSTQRTFGQKGSDSSGLDPDTILPYKTVADDGLCTMIISTGDPKKADTSVWYKFWDATVAINAMCIRNGYKSGIWSDLGIRGKLEIQVFGGAFGGDATVA